MLARLGGERVLDLDARLGVDACAADAVQEQVHRAQAGGVVDDLDAVEGVVAEELLLVAVERVVISDVVVSGEQEPAGAAGRVGDRWLEGHRFILLEGHAQRRG